MSISSVAAKMESPTMSLRSSTRTQPVSSTTSPYSQTRKKTIRPGSSDSDSPVCVTKFSVTPPALEIPDLATTAPESPAPAAKISTPVTTTSKSVRFYGGVVNYLPRDQDWYSEEEKKDMFYTKTKKKHMHRMVRHEADVIQNRDEVYCSSQGYRRQRDTALVPLLERLYAGCCNKTPSPTHDFEMLIRKYTESAGRGLEKALLNSTVYKKRKRYIKLAVILYKMTKPTYGTNRASQIMADFCAMKTAPAKRFSLMLGRADELCLAHVVVPVEEEVQELPSKVKTVNLPSSKNVAGVFSPSKAFHRISQVVSPQRIEPPPLMVWSGELA